MIKLWSFIKGIAVQNETDRTKQLTLEVDATATTGTITALKSKQTANRDLTFPDVSGEIVEKAAAQVLTNKSIDADTNTITNIENADIKSGANIALNKLSALTASKALTSDGSGVISASTVTSVELGRLSGLTSSAVGVSDTQTLTNKTIDGDNNTVQDLALTSLKTDLANANNFVSRDVSGIVVSSKAVPTGTVVGNSDTQILTNKSIDSNSNTITNIKNADIATAANIALTKLAATTVSRALVSDGSGVISPATTTSTEIGFVNGVTSSIQTQLDGKVLKSLYSAKGSLLGASAAATPVDVAVGSNGQVLTVDSTQTAGFRWATVTTPSAILAVTTKTAAYTAVNTDDVILVDASSASFTLTLFTAVGNTGKKLIIKKTNSTNTVTVDANGSETIDGSLTYLLQTILDEVTIISNGTGWVIESSYRIRVYAYYTTSSGQSMTGAAFTIVNFNTGVSDVLSTVTTGAGWVFTAPRDDVYSITSMIAGSAVAASSQYILDVFKGGSVIARLNRQRNTAASADDQPISGSVQIALIKGDTINVRGLFSTTQNLTTSSSDNYIIITSQGGY